MVPHAHRICHIVFKVGGPDILFGIGQREHLIATQYALLINAWERHFYYHRSDVPTILLALYLDPQWLKQVDRQFAKSAHPKFFSCPVVEISGKLKQFQNDLLDLITQHFSPSNHTVEELIAAVFAEIMTRTPTPHFLFPLGAHGELGYDARIRHAIESLLQGGSAAVKVQELHRMTDLSRAQFFRLFHRSTGLTPAAFLNMLRLEASITKVSQRNFLLQEVAAELGFDTVGNFTRFFTAQQGIAPSKYRKVVEQIEVLHRAQ
jgi:AraC-like DNA-binding protein